MSARQDTRGGGQLTHSIATCASLIACAAPLACGVPDARAPNARALLMRPDDPAWAEPSPSVYRAVFTTTAGSFVIEGHRAWAPLGADRFFHLVRHGFFDDSRFYRVVEGFIAQFGLPGDPAVTSLWLDRTIPDDPVSASNTRGRVAFAFTEPGTRTTQVFINLVDNVRLDSAGFAPFGEVVEGMDVVDRLYAGYGEAAGGGLRRGDQSRIIAEGNAHLDRDFPLLDRILTARIEAGTPP